MNRVCLNLIAVAVLFQLGAWVVLCADEEMQMQDFGDFFKKNNLTSLGGGAGEDQHMLADQANEEEVTPTRAAKIPDETSTFPPLRHQDGSSNATKTNSSAATESAETTTAKGDNKGGAGFCAANLAMILCLACTLRFIY